MAVVGRPAVQPMLAASTRLARWVRFLCASRFPGPNVRSFTGKVNSTTPLLYVVHDGASTKAQGGVIDRGSLVDTIPVIAVSFAIKASRAVFSPSVYTGTVTLREAYLCRVAALPWR